MANSQYEHHDFNIIHVISKLAYCTHEASSNGFIKRTQRFGCCRPAGNGVGHSARSEIELCEQFFIRDRLTSFSAGFCRRLDIGEILEGFDRTIKNSGDTNTARRPTPREAISPGFTLSSSNAIALLIAKLRQSH